MVQIKIIRHSERFDYTHPLRWLLYIGQYWCDAPLTTMGHKQAFQKGRTLINKNFQPQRIYTSPYNRAITTATEIQKSFPQAELVIESLLCEYQPSYKHTINLYPEGIPTHYDGKATNFSYPENYEQFKDRVNFIIFKLIQKHDTDLIIITHGEVLKVLINYFQTCVPDLFLDSHDTPYLTTISFTYADGKIDETTIIIE